MARTAINVVQITRTGVSVAAGTAGDVANGNAVANDGGVALLLKNTNASSTARVLTIKIVETVDGVTVPSRTVSVAAGAQVAVGPFDPNIYGGRLQLNVDNAELTILPVRI